MLFCLMPDLMLLICCTFASFEMSVRKMESRFATCSSVIFSPMVGGCVVCIARSVDVDVSWKLWIACDLMAHDVIFAFFSV